jgi:hypothetical protein
VARTRPRDSLAGRTRLIVDGSNQRAPSSEPPPEEVYARSLRPIFPGSIEILVVFDTDPPMGSATIRAIGGVTVIHARAGGGDDAIVRRASEMPLRTLVVTDDAELRRRIGELGAQAERNDWLRQRSERGRIASSSVGQSRRHPSSPLASQSQDDVDDRKVWRPGRKATLKRGPARRPPKSR